MPPFNNPEGLRHRSQQQQQQQPPTPRRRAQDAATTRIYPTIPTEREPTAQDRNALRKQTIRDAVSKARAGPTPAPTTSSPATPLTLAPQGPCGGGTCSAMAMYALAAAWLFFPCAIPVVITIMVTTSSCDADGSPAKHLAAPSCDVSGSMAAGGGKTRCTKKAKAVVTPLLPVFALAWFLGKPLCCAGFVVAAVAGALSLYNQHWGQQHPSSCTFFKAGAFVLYAFGLRTFIIAAFATKMLGPLILGWPDSKCKQRMCAKMKACRDTCRANAAGCKGRVMNAVRDLFPGHETNAATAATTTALTAPAAAQQPAAQHHAEPEEQRRWQQQPAGETKPALQWATKTWPDGSSYTGSMLSGQRHGHGSYNWADGSSYTGEWQDDKLHGSGVFKFANGDVYTGQYADDAKQGHGKYQWAGSDQVFEGRWEGDTMADSVSTSP